MSQDQTPQLVSEAAEYVYRLTVQANLSDDERAFVNEQATALSELIVERWAAERYRQRKLLRPCCAGLAVAVALGLAHRTATRGETLLG